MHANGLVKFYCNLCAGNQLELCFLVNKSNKVIVNHANQLTGLNAQCFYRSMTAERNQEIWINIWRPIKLIKSIQCDFSFGVFHWNDMRLYESGSYNWIMIKLVKRKEHHDLEWLFHPTENLTNLIILWRKCRSKGQIRFEPLSIVVIFNPLMRVLQTFKLLMTTKKQFMSRLFNILTHPWRNSDSDSDNDNDAPEHWLMNTPWRTFW